MHRWMVAGMGGGGGGKKRSVSRACKLMSAWGAVGDIELERGMGSPESLGLRDWWSRWTGSTCGSGCTCKFTQQRLAMSLQKVWAPLRIRRVGALVVEGRNKCTFDR